jgi:phage shock protein A
MQTSEPVVTEPSDLRREVHALRVEVRDLNAQVRGLVEAWQTAQGVVKFMKMLGSVATAAAAIWALVVLAIERKS